MRAHCIAAVRELFEESGLLLCKPHVTIPSREEWREKIHKDASTFIDFCQMFGISPMIGEIYPWSRWVTPVAEKWRYDTQFFVAVAPEQETVATQDHFETTQCDWFTPQEAIESAKNGKIKLSPPTWITISELMELPTIDHVIRECNNANRRKTEPIQPVLKIQNGEVHVIMPGDEHNGGKPGDRRRLITLKSSEGMPNADKFRWESTSPTTTANDKAKL